MIVVLGILATVAVYSVRGIRDRGEVASCEGDRRVLHTAAESYFAQNARDTILVTAAVVPGVSGTTAEGTLVQVGLLADESTLYDVAADGSVDPADGSRCAD